MRKIIRTSTVPDSLYGLLKGQLKYIHQYFELIAVSGAGEYLAKVAEREGVRVVPVEMQRQIAVFKDLRSLFQLFRCFRREKPAIVHSITPKAGLLSMCAAYFANVPIRAHTFTGLVFPSKTGLMKVLLMGMDFLLCKFATHIYPEGEGVKADLIKYKITNKPLKVLANGNVNGVDTQYFNPEQISITNKNELKNALGISPNDFIYLFVGRLVGDKGINELVAAFLEINQTNPNAKLLLVGPYETDLDPLKAETINEINKNKAIISTGFQSDVRPFLSIGDVFVFPSYREGFPNVVLQAGCMELPCIVTNINGSNEIIRHNVNGLIIPVKDQYALYQSMTAIFENTDLRSKLKSKARQIIVSSFEQSIVWEATVNEYHQMLKNV